MAQPKGKIPFSTAQRMVKAELMTEDALQAGVANGTIAPKPSNRDYGKDHQVYEAIQKYIDECNEHCEEYRFSVMGRALSTSEAGEGN
jgi:hypothetical protein